MAKAAKAGKKSKAKGPGADPDIYVGLLFVSLASLATGCIFFYLELSSYQFMMPSG